MAKGESRGEGRGAGAPPARRPPSLARAAALKADAGSSTDTVAPLAVHIYRVAR
jgi:hypothetical protein